MGLGTDIGQSRFGDDYTTRIATIRCGARILGIGSLFPDRVRWSGATQNLAKEQNYRKGRLSDYLPDGLSDVAR